MIVKNFLILCYFPFITDSLMCATIIDLISIQWISKKKKETNDLREKSIATWFAKNTLRE